jgi:hypothetical protein
MTYRRADDPVRQPERRSASLAFEVVHVGVYPDDPVRCLLYREDGCVKARINLAHGEPEAWDHAAHHGSNGVGELGFVCVVGQPCGYGGDPTYLVRMALE